MFSLPLGAWLQSMPSHALGRLWGLRAAEPLKNPDVALPAGSPREAGHPTCGVPGVLLSTGPDLLSIFLQALALTSVPHRELEALLSMPKEQSPTSFLPPASFQSRIHSIISWHWPYLFERHFVHQCCAGTKDVTMNQMGSVRSPLYGVPKLPAAGKRMLVFWMDSKGKQGRMEARAKISEETNWAWKLEGRQSQMA